MTYSRLTITLCCILVLSLFVNQSTAAAKLENKTTQAAPVRGVPNDLWADIVLGKPDFGEMTPYEVTGSRVFNPGGVIIDRSVTPNRMYVYDGGNSRVLGLHVNNQSGRRAELVLGQPGLDGYSACNGDGNLQHYPQRAVASASTLCTMPETQVSPREGGSFANMAVDAQGNLYVPDFFNHRVLLYNSPFDTDTIADAVWGQSDFSGNVCNHNHGNFQPDSSSLCLGSIYNEGFVGGVGLDNAKNLWVADNANNRVLRFPYDPATGHASAVANLVLGQANFTTSTSGATMNKMAAPAAVRVSATGNVYVADSRNNRILIFNPPFTNGMVASSTLGTKLHLPTSIEFDQNNNIWVSDSSDNQLLRFTPAKVVDRVLFKDQPAYNLKCGATYVTDGPDFYFPGPKLHQNSANLCDARGSIGIDSDGNIWVTGSSFLQDVRRYPAPFPAPKTGVAHSADVQLFQAYAPGQTNAVTRRGLSDPRGIAIGGSQLIISDGGRILFWNNAPASLSTGKAADGVIVTPNFSSTVTPPIGQVRVDGQNRLWVLRGDTITVYHLPLVTGAQPFYTLRPPVALRESIIWNPNLDIAGMVVTNNAEFLWLSDPNNHRVIRVASPLTSPVVDVVLGQLNGNGNQCNQGRGLTQPSSNSLCFPGGIAMDKNGNIFVSDFALEDEGNRRLLEYDARLFPPAPTSALFGIAASRVYGTNGSFTVAGCLNMATDPLCKPLEPSFNQAGEMVVGVSGYSAQRFPWVYQNPLSRLVPVGSLKDYYSMPSATYYDSDDNLYVADRNRGRVLIYLADHKTISGNAGTSGAILSYTDGKLKTVTADGSGNYTLKVKSGWSGSVTPTKKGCIFTASDIDYSDITSDQTNQNYAAQCDTYTISGNTSMAGVELYYYDGSMKTVVTDMNKHYTITVSSGWSGSITPSGIGTTFTPPSRNYTNLSDDLTQQNYASSYSAVFFSDANEDGWILETSEKSDAGGTISNKGLIVLGDNQGNQQYRSILSFDTSSLPDAAIINSITLKLKKAGIQGNGNPISIFKGIMIAIKTGRFGGVAALQSPDFQRDANKSYGPISPMLVGNLYKLNLTIFKPYINKLASAGGLTQMRLSFRLDDNNNEIANYLSLFSGNAVNSADRPQLEILYTLP